MSDFFVSGKSSKEYLNMIKNDKYLFANFRVKNHTHGNTNMLIPGQFFLPKFIPKVGYVFSLEKEVFEMQI